MMSLHGRKRVDFSNTVSLTKQEFKKESDVNQIMKKYKKVAGSDFLSKYNGIVSGKFGDFTEITDYRDALAKVAEAKETFMQLPAKVRTRFRNDPAEFLDFVQNPANKEEMYFLGLAEKKESVPSSPVSSMSVNPTQIQG